MTTRRFHGDLDEDRGLLVVHGELDELASGGLRETIAQATAELTSSLAIDLANVSFMPSHGIGVLATSQATARSNGADVVLVAPAGSVAQRLLTICAVDHVESLDRVADPSS